MAHLFKVIYFIELKTPERLQHMQQWVDGTYLSSNYPQQETVKANTAHSMVATVHMRVSVPRIITIDITCLATCKQAWGFLFH